MTHTSDASASGKIILSGEYAVVFGKRGIAIPSELRINISLSESQKNDGLTIAFVPSPLGGGAGVGVGVEDRWIKYAEKVTANIIERTTPLAGTLTIENNLPLGKGMGSSTSLVIAMCRCILRADCREIALAIENKVNPGNSGIDFAVISEEKPILFSKNNVPEVIELPKNLLTGISLIDTGTPNEATPELVAWVRTRYEAGEPTVLEAIDTIGRCTERILAGEALKTVMRDHHRAQIALGVVPEKTQKIIAEIESKGGSAKVLGAGGRTGGGGMVLALL